MSIPSKAISSTSQTSPTGPCVGFAQHLSPGRRIPTLVISPGRWRRRWGRVVCQSPAMDGCRADHGGAVETMETRTFPAVPTVGLATENLRGLVAKLKSEKPAFSSGIIRLQVSLLPTLPDLFQMPRITHFLSLPCTWYENRHVR